MHLKSCFGREMFMDTCFEMPHTVATNDPNETEKQAENLYSYVKELATLKYESEMRREDSLIQQSSHMQTAFSFMSAALFMAVPVLLEYRGEKLSLPFFFAAFSSILLCLLLSLIAASLAQRRVLKKTFMSIPEIESFISSTYEQTLSRAAQLKQWVQVVGEVQVSLERANESRVKLIRISMGFFLGSIGLIILWYIFACIKML